MLSYNEMEPRLKIGAKNEIPKDQELKKKAILFLLVTVPLFVYFSIDF